MGVPQKAQKYGLQRVGAREVDHRRVLVPRVESISNMDLAAGRPYEWTCGFSLVPSSISP
jgi:hypothetical protein